MDEEGNEDEGVDGLGDDDSDVDEDRWSSKDFQNLYRVL